MEEQKYENIKTIIHDDFLNKPAVNAICYEQSQEHVVCPNCGKAANLDPEILTSMPPQRRIRCPHCGYVGSEFCHSLNIFYGDEKPAQPWPYDVMPEYKATSTTKCIICGEETTFAGEIDHPYICKNCKAAIIAMRKALGTWNK